MAIQILNHKSSNNCCGSNCDDNCSRNYDYRYYTKDEIDLKLKDIEIVIFGEGEPDPEMGELNYVYIDTSKLRKPAYRKLFNEEESIVEWVHFTDLNEIDNEILEATQDV